MMYKNVETYLNEEYIKPIMFYAENGQLDPLYNFLCALANKYKEQNTYMLAYEKLLEKHKIKYNASEFMDIVAELDKTYPVGVDFSKLESPFTDEEQVYKNTELVEIAQNVYKWDDDENHHYIANRIKSLRVEAGLSQAELARRAGLSKTALNNIETGKSGPSLENFNRILGALGYAVTYRKLAKE